MQTGELERHRHPSARAGQRQGDSDFFESIYGCASRRGALGSFPSNKFRAPAESAAARGSPARPSFPQGSKSMRPRTRREFFTDVGTGMVVASVGSALAAD